MALTWGRACTTVSSRARIPVAIFNSFNTVGDIQPWLSVQAMSVYTRVWTCKCVNSEKGGGAQSSM